MLTLIRRLTLSLRIRLGNAQFRHTGNGMLVWAVLVGFLGGMTSLLYRDVNIGIKQLLTGETGDIVSIANDLSPDIRLAVPALGGICAGILLSVAARLFPEKGSQDYLEAIRLGNGVISVRSTLLRLLSSLFSISSGASIGREGGMVQFSALAASSAGRLLRLPKARLRLLVACGGAAGLASAYDTPLGGALFIAEVVLQSMAIEALGPLILASLVATLTARQWTGLQPVFTLRHLSHDYMNIDLVPVLGLGIIAGLACPLLLAMLEKARALFRCSRLPLPLRLGLGGLLVGLISVAEPDVWGNGHAVTEMLLKDNPGLPFVTRILALKILATVAAVGSGAIGGIFTPTLLIGAAVGWLYAHGLHHLLPAIPLDPIAYATLGLGAFLSGTTFAPIMAVLMVFEMTLDPNAILPLIIVTMTARYVAVALRPESVYARSLGPSRNRVPHLTPVTELVTPVTFTVPLDATADRVSQAFCLTTAMHLWVVDGEGRYQGAISLHSMKHFLDDDRLKDIHACPVFMEDDVPGIGEHAVLSEALQAFSNTPAECLPVLGQDRRLLGEISRTDLMLSLA